MEEGRNKTKKKKEEKDIRCYWMAWRSEEQSSGSCMLLQVCTHMHDVAALTLTGETEVRAGMMALS